MDPIKGHEIAQFGRGEGRQATEGARVVGGKRRGARIWNGGGWCTDQRDARARADGMRPHGAPAWCAAQLENVEYQNPYRVPNCRSREVKLVGQKAYKFWQEAREHLEKYINLFYVNSGHSEPFSRPPRAPVMLEFRNFLTDTRIFGDGLLIEKLLIDGNWSREITDFSADTNGRFSPILRPVFKVIKICAESQAALRTLQFDVSLAIKIVRNHWSPVRSIPGSIVCRELLPEPENS
ncbi:hypothetical protein C8R44DRAFT_746430 [Mycena epipterygia]|nr:hypothetical protein C8R44DRAFT_746430 [Mycena epipterygia]